MPIRPQAKLHATALAHMRITLDEMTKNTLKHANKIQQLITSNNTVNSSILNSDNLRNVQSTVQSYNVNVQDVAKDTLIPCIDHHYDNLINAQRSSITKHIDQAHSHLTDNAKFGILKLNTMSTIVKAVSNAINYWKHCQTSHTTTTVGTPAQKKDRSVDNNNNKKIDNPIENRPESQATTPSCNRKSQKQRRALKTAHDPEQCTNPNCLDCATKNIVNLSNTQLTKTQVLLLSKGLFFVPTASNAKPTEILRDFNTFKMKARRKLCRMINPPNTRVHSDEPDLYRKPTTTHDTDMDNERQQLGPQGHESRNILPGTTPHTKTQSHQTLTLRELTLNNNLIINKADKGSTIVVRDRNDYIEEGISHLSDENTYSPLDRDHTSDVTKFVKNTLQSLRKVGLLSPQTSVCHHPT